MEYITANGTKYECETVVTSTNSILFSMENQEVETIKAAFLDVTELTVSNESEETYGTYSNLIFESATVYADGAIEVVMHIPSETELRLTAMEEANASLEVSQAEQDELLAELMFGSEEEAETTEEGEVNE